MTDEGQLYGDRRSPYHCVTNRSPGGLLVAAFQTVHVGSPVLGGKGLGGLSFCLPWDSGKLSELRSKASRARSCTLSIAYDDEDKVTSIKTGPSAAAFEKVN